MYTHVESYYESLVRRHEHQAAMEVTATTIVSDIMVGYKLNYSNSLQYSVPPALKKSVYVQCDEKEKISCSRRLKNTLTHTVLKTSLEVLRMQN